MTICTHKQQTLRQEITIYKELASQINKHKILGITAPKYCMAPIQTIYLRIKIKLAAD
jgi:hypothetical protein